MKVEKVFTSRVKEGKEADREEERIKETHSHDGFWIEISSNLKGVKLRANGNDDYLLLEPDQIMQVTRQLIEAAEGCELRRAEFMLDKLAIGKEEYFEMSGFDVFITAIKLILGNKSDKTSESLAGIFQAFEKVAHQIPELPLKIQTILIPLLMGERVSLSEINKLLGIIKVAPDDERYRTH